VRHATPNAFRKDTSSKIIITGQAEVDRTQPARVPPHVPKQQPPRRFRSLAHGRTLGPLSCRRHVDVQRLPEGLVGSVVERPRQARLNGKRLAHVLTVVMYRESATPGWHTSILPTTIARPSPAGQQADTAPLSALTGMKRPLLEPERPRQRRHAGPHRKPELAARHPTARLPPTSTPSKVSGHTSNAAWATSPPLSTTSPLSCGTGSSASSTA
jgi:hypothetical protein